MMSEYKLCKADKDEVRQLLDTLGTQKIQIKELYDITDSMQDTEELIKDVQVLKSRINEFNKLIKDKIDIKDINSVNSEINKINKTIENNNVDFTKFKTNAENNLLQLTEMWALIKKLETIKLNREDF